MRDMVSTRRRHRGLLLPLLGFALLAGGPLACGVPTTRFEDRPVVDYPASDEALDDPWAMPSESPDTSATGTGPLPTPAAVPTPPSSAEVTWVADVLPPRGDWQPGGIYFTGALDPAGGVPSRLLWQVSGGRQLEEVELSSDGNLVPVGSRYGVSDSSLAPGAGPVVADGTLVAAAPGGNLFAWMRESRAPLQLGRPFADRVQALALTPDALWVAREGRVVPFRRDRLVPDGATPSYVVETRALAGSPDGSLWLGLPGSRLLVLGPGGESKLTDVPAPGSTEWRSLALDADAGLVVCLFRDALVIVDRDGKRIFSTQSGYFVDASSVCVLPEGTLLVCDAGSRRLVRFHVVNRGLPVDK